MPVETLLISSNATFSPRPRTARLKFPLLPIQTNFCVVPSTIYLRRISSLLRYTNQTPRQVLCMRMASDPFFLICRAMFCLNF